MSDPTATEKRLNSTADDLDPDKIYVVGIAVFRPKSELDEDATPQLLLVQRSAHESMANLWELPGGGVDPGETMRVAAYRELREETSLTATEIVGECSGRSWISPKHKKTYIKFNFVARVKQPIEVKVDPQEHQKWRWLMESDLETFDFEANAELAKEHSEVVKDAFAWYRKNAEKLE